MSYHRGRRSHSVVSFLAHLVLFIVVWTLLLGDTAVVLMADLVRLIGDTVVALTEQIAQ